MKILKSLSVLLIILFLNKNSFSQAITVDLELILAVDVSSRVEKYIDSSLSLFNGNVEEEEWKEERIFSIGRCLLKVTNGIDKTLGGVILNTYINCLLLGTTTLYAGSSVFFIKNSNNLPFN